MISRLDILLIELINNSGDLVNVQEDNHNINVAIFFDDYKDNEVGTGQVD
jgi:hypothetical protein